MTPARWKSLDAFTQGYIECALWAGANEDGEPLDAEWTIFNISDNTLEEIIADCRDFQEFNFADLELANEMGRDDSHLGHDFFLSRNGHGTGFWDRGLGAIGDRLHAASKVYSTFELIPGDNDELSHHN